MRYCIYVFIGLFSLAVPLSARTDDPAKELSQEEKADLEKQATSLDEEVGQFVRDGKPADARQRAEESLGIRRRLYPPATHPNGHPNLATSLNNLAFVLNGLGQPAKALPYFEQALAMRQKQYPPTRFPDGHPDLALSLNNMGYVFQSLGQPAKAFPYFEQALTVWQKLYPLARFPDGHLQLAVSLNNLGYALHSLGQPAQALPYFEQALAMKQRLYPPNRFPDGHPDLARSLNNLASEWKFLGQPAKALPYFEQALAMTQRVYPPNRFPNGHPELARSLNNLADVWVSLGQLARALPYFEQSLAMVQKLYPPVRFPDGHPDLATGLDNLAVVIKSLGQPARALVYNEQALAMWQKLYPPTRFPDGHPHLAGCLNNLGMLHKSLGQPNKGLPYNEQALAMRQKLYPPTRFPDGHPELASSLNNLGFLLSFSGQPAKALPYFEQALAMCQKLYSPVRFPAGHPDLAMCFNNMAFGLESLGQSAKALPYCEQALTTYQALANRILDASAESQALRFLQRQPLSRDALLTVSRQTPLPEEKLYDRLWPSRSAVTQVLERRQQAFVAAAERPQLKQRWDELTDVRRQLARLFLNPPRDTKVLDEQARKLTNRKESLESELAEELPALAEQQRLDRLGPADLRRSMPERTAFVDLGRYAFIAFDPKAPGFGGATRTPNYVAFVLTRQQVTRVELGEAAPIEDALTEWRRAIDERKTSPAAEELRRRVWQPIAKHLPAGTDSVYLAPDGALTELPWAALPGDQPKSVLLEQYSLAVVPHGRYLLARLRDVTKLDPAGLLLAVGGVRYNDKPHPLTKPDAGELLAAGVPDRDGSPGTWAYLAATEREIQRLAGLAGPRTRPLSGAEASTARLVQEMPQARVVHLATHGFFAQSAFLEEKRREAQLLKDWQFEAGRTTEAVGLGARNPLAFAGLVLAGANRPAEAGPDGGILTGEAIINLRLERLHLAVLSACQTGLGAEADGECVHNLQYAFHVAGCKNVIASLWNVPDQATAALMAVFYDELLTKGRPPREALRRAQLYLYSNPHQIRELAERGPIRLRERQSAPEEGSNRASTKDWAGFILSGLGK
jgi:CHAT domain-containing protein/Tfp pilus assembly protein PilF